MRDSHVLHNFVVQADFVKRVADFVRYKTNATRQIQLTSFPELNPDDGIASFTIQSGVRRVWSPHDVSVIEAKFKGQKRAPLKRDILSTFKQDPVLAHILEREGATRCYEKVTPHLGRASPVKVCLTKEEGDVQTPIAFTFPIEISFQINVNRIVHRIVLYHFYLLYIVLYIQL